MPNDDNQPVVPAEQATTEISDFQFVSAVKRLKTLRTFMQQAGVGRAADDKRAASSLYLLKYSPLGRSPATEEWELVESLTESSFAALPEGLRRKFFLGELPSWVLVVAGCLTVVSLLALLGAEISVGHTGTLLLFCYLVWLIALGAIGSVAFIGMNALSVQQDITFDLSNVRLMILRIVLGALFGLVLTLPFGFPEFNKFIKSLNTTTTTVASTFGSTNVDVKFGEISSQALALLLPFILGFSTSLVIMLLNRLVDAVQAFFGKQAAPESSASFAGRTSNYGTGYGSSRMYGYPSGGTVVSKTNYPSTSSGAAVSPALARVETQASPSTPLND